MFSLCYGENTPNNIPEVHVRAILDGRLVLARWLSRKEWWHFFVEDIIWFNVNESKITFKGVCAGPLPGDFAGIEMVEQKKEDRHDG